MYRTITIRKEALQGKPYRFSWIITAQLQISMNIGSEPSIQLSFLIYMQTSQIRTRQSLLSLIGIPAGKYLGRISDQVRRK